MRNDSRRPSPVSRRVGAPRAGRVSGTPPPASATPAPAPADPRPVATLERLIATALTFKGTPYRNGGSTPAGFDCSGFVQYVFARHGQSLPREVNQQFKVGERVDRDDVQPGDLVFFQTVSQGASHVGIAIGPGEFVHAPSSRGVVRVERYTIDYWARRWVGARRIRLPEGPEQLASGGKDSGRDVTALAHQLP
jgi:cell wall-associated NlpC family hydrolase